jgi:hypothetical protein
MGGPASNYATAGIALRIIWLRKPHHYVKVEIPSVGTLPCKKENCWEASKKFSRILWRRPRPKLGSEAKERRWRWKFEFFWVVTPCNVVVGYQRFRGPCFLNLQIADGGSKVLRKVGILPQHHTVSQPRRTRILKPVCVPKYLLKSH